MTKKKKNILETALQLFATEGYATTPTKKIAKGAGVSEGLIFRHYQNKEGLLDAIMAKGAERVSGYLAEIEKMEDPRKVIEAVIDLPFSIDPSEHDFWRLLYSLKWQKRVYNEAMEELMIEVLIKAFTDLGFDNAEAEADLLLMLIDGIATSILLKDERDYEQVVQAIKDKYPV